MLVDVCYSFYEEDPLLAHEWEPSRGIVAAIE